MIGPAFFISFLQQALAEEILFRGFIAKHLIHKPGRGKGNFLQAIIFGMMHVLFAVSDTREFPAYLLIAVLTAIGGWLLGYLDVKIYNGSIWPSIFLHGIGNFLMLMSVAFQFVYRHQESCVT